ncbi:MAG: metallophosphoesterase, partial [Mucilaginibacter sp.]|nr:metallophosphoesterase [Mucilaginibacter sp.]
MHNSGFLKVFAIIAFISLLFDWYVHSGLKTLTADWQSNLLRGVVLWGYLIISVGVTALFLFGFGAFST